MSDRAEKLAEQLKRAGIRNVDLIEVIKSTPRESFISDSQIGYAYMDSALPIECGQTISQPYIVAIMTEELLNVKPKKILEIGTGSGYQAAILSQLVDNIFTIERIEYLYRHAKKRLADLGYENINVIYGDGRLGYKEAAPYDGIIMTAATEDVPQALFDQLADGGKLVAPVGQIGFQELMSYTRHNDSFTSKFIESVAFVPLLRGVE